MHVTVNLDTRHTIEICILKKLKNAIHWNFQPKSEPRSAIKIFFYLNSRFNGDVYEM